MIDPAGPGPGGDGFDAPGLPARSRVVVGEDDRPSGRKQIVFTVVWAVILGVLITLPLGRQRQISIEIWLLAVSIWLARAAVLHMLGAAPVRAGRPRPILKRRRTAADPEGHRPSELLSLEGLILSARDSDRAFSLRLQPRLMTLTDHYLRVHHGIDPVRRPDQAEAVLGDTAWLVDPAETGRTPTLAEVDRLLGRVMVAPPGRNMVAPPGRNMVAPPGRVTATTPTGRGADR